MQTQIWTRRGQNAEAMFSPDRTTSLGQHDNKYKGRDHKAWLGVWAVLLLCGATSVSSAQTYTVLADFDKTTGYNLSPQSLVQGFDGNFYGSAQTGGKNGSAGTVFKLIKSGELTAIYNFCPQKGCNDGAQPSYGVTLNTDGNFYGATIDGGAFHRGTLFKLTPTGALTTLHTFCSLSHCSDGSVPLSVVRGFDGNFYGTTQSGGANPGPGTVFKITPTGSLATLYTFCSLSNCADGQLPNPLILGVDGNFYGTTEIGGSYNAGTVFKISPAGVLTTLYNFCSKKVGNNCLDGSFPTAPLVQASDGNFYGVVGAGGANNYGTVFRVESNGTLITLYNFCSQSGCSDGGGPLTALIQATDGNLYGTTGEFGNTNNGGTAFKLTLQGALKTLYLFCSQNPCSDGGLPNGLLQGTDGNFYGTTVNGGTFAGVAFQLSTGLGPFVKAVPGFGKVGSAIAILGTNLSGTTSVRFHGVASTFTVVSDSEIRATVPTGATTGKIAVVTPNGRLLSNEPFLVRP